MDLLTFIAKSEWPAVIGGALFYYRDPLGKLIERVRFKNVKVFGIETELEQQLDEAEKSATKAGLVPAIPARMTAPTAMLEETSFASKLTANPTQSPLLAENGDAASDEGHQSEAIALPECKNSAFIDKKVRESLLKYNKEIVSELEKTQLVLENPDLATNIAWIKLQNFVREIAPGSETVFAGRLTAIAIIKAILDAGIDLSAEELDVIRGIVNVRNVINQSGIGNIESGEALRYVGLIDRVIDRLRSALPKH